MLQIREIQYILLSLLLRKSLCKLQRQINENTHRASCHAHILSRCVQGKVEILFLQLTQQVLYLLPKALRQFFCLLRYLGIFFG